MHRSRNIPLGVFAGVGVAYAMVAGFGSVPALAQEKILHVFQGGSDGEYPQTSLIADAVGNLYGTTRGGGVGYGTIFQVAIRGGESVFYTFKGGTDGANPVAGLTEDEGGNFYGSTAFGGATNEGVVFELAADGTETVLHAFQGGADGAFPAAALMEDSAGNFYGTTGFGGAPDQGTVFELPAGGAETVLHAFQGGSDGSLPQAAVIRDSAGNLYGTTEGGGGGAGCNDDDLGCGTVFKIGPDGIESVLYAFQGGADGALPEAALIQDGAGNFYGTTKEGGEHGGGTVFELSPGGSETILYSFKGGNDGEYPESALIADAKGNFYGTTINGGGTACGNSGCGTVFELSAKGREKVLYAFRATRGSNPEAGLLLGAHRELYGTTLEGGGKAEEGVVFRLKR